MSDEPDLITRLLDSKIVVAALIGAVAYLLRGWLERNKAVADARVKSSVVIADAMSHFFAVTGSEKTSEIESALRAVKSEMPKGVLYFSRRTEIRASEFLLYANNLVNQLNDEGSDKQMLRANATLSATNFMNSLRLDVLGWSLFGICHRILTFCDRVKYRKEKRRASRGKKSAGSARSKDR